MDSLHLNTPSQERSAKAVKAIMQAARELIEADASKSPTSRELVEKSGYSMGTIYR